MKKINLFLMLLFLAGASIFSSCSKDDDPLVDPNPTIDFKGGSTYTSSDVTIDAGQQILVGFNAAYNTSTKKNLTNFLLTLTTNNVAQTLVDSTINTDVYSADVTISFPQVGTSRLTAKITDKDGYTDEVSFNITVEQAGVKVTKYSNVELGSFNDAVGSFYATSDNSVYTVTNAPDNQSKIDMIFYKGVTNANTIAAPDDASLSTIPTLGVDSWTVKNQTRFIKTTMTAAEFDAIGEYYVFPEFIEANASSKANLLEETQVVFFRTQAGKLGYFKVVDLYSRGDLAKFDVIVVE